MGKKFICLNCGTENNWKCSTTNKYCNGDCFHKHKWEHTIKKRIEEGKGGDPFTLKKYLAEVRGNSCECCGIRTEYNGRPLVLQLDHIDGNSDNENVANLRLLCPNCHSQTDTYAAKGQGVRYHKKNTKRNLYLQDYKS